MIMPPKPNFIIAGAGRSGTTTLYSYLKQHLKVFMPTKEISYFGTYYKKGEESYLNCFKNFNVGKFFE